MDSERCSVCYAELDETDPKVTLAHPDVVDADDSHCHSIIEVDQREGCRFVWGANHFRKPNERGSHFDHGQAHQEKHASPDFEVGHKEHNCLSYTAYNHGVLNGLFAPN